MNRLETARSLAPPVPSPSRQGSPPLAVSSGGEISEAFFAPQNYEPNYRYPLVVWLHDEGEDERQLAAVLAGVSTRNYVGCSVRGTCSVQAGFGWRQTLDQIDFAQQRVTRLVRRAQRRFHVHPERIFLAGQGSGGTMALRIAFRQPHRFAGAVSIGGQVPQGHAPLGNLEATRSLPVFLAGGAGGTRYPAAQVCDDLRLLHTAGISITLRHYPCGDELHPQCLHDADAWLMDCLAARGTAVVR